MDAESQVLIVKTDQENKPRWSARKLGLAAVLAGFALVAFAGHAQHSVAAADVSSADDVTSMSATSLMMMPVVTASSSSSSSNGSPSRQNKRVVTYVPTQPSSPSTPKRGDLVVPNASQKEMRDRIASVASTQKITDAMKLVAAAKVRKAQDAVISARPFSDQLVKVLFAINSRLSGEDIDAPLTNVRPVKTVLLLVFTGDRGLCGGFNNFVLKKAEARVAELAEQGVAAKIVSVGKKGNVYWKRRPQYTVLKQFEMGQKPNTVEAQAIADEVYSEFVGEEVDKVELVYSRFISLIASEPTIQTMLPLSPEGQVCNTEGVCIDATNDAIFKLTSEEGKLSVVAESASTEVAELEGVMQFEQDPNQILDAVMPLYLNSIMLRALQESLASELAARMNAMSSASDNAKELKKDLTLAYNRKRQAKITSEIIELVAGAASA